MKDIPLKNPKSGKAVLKTIAAGLVGTGATILLGAAQAGNLVGVLAGTVPVLVGAALFLVNEHVKEA